MPGIVIQIQGDGAGAAEALRIIEERMQQTKTKGAEMGAQLAKAGETVQHAFEMIGLGIGVREAIAGVKEMISASVELAMEIGHMSKQTGISTENLSVLKYVSDQTGVSFEGLSKGFKKLSTDLFDIGHGSDKTLVAFQAIGISQKQLAATGGDLFKVMGLVADSFEKMPDGATKNAVATKLFGKAGQELIPILDQGSAALEKYRSRAEELGIVLHADTVEKLETIHKSMNDVKEAATGASIEISSKLVPAFEWLSKTITWYGKSFAGGLDVWNQWADNAVHAIGRVAWAFASGPLMSDPAAFDKMFPGMKEKTRSSIKDTLDAFKNVHGNDAGGGDGLGLGEKQVEGARFIVELLRAAHREADAINRALDAAFGPDQWKKATEGPDAESIFGVKKLPNVTLDPDAYKDEARQAEVQRRIQQQMDENAANSGSGGIGTRQAAGVIGGFMDQLTAQALAGRISFKSLVDSAVSDLERFAMKVLEKKALLPILNALFGMGGSGPASSGQYAETQMLPAGMAALQIPYLAGGGDLKAGDMAVVGDGGNGSGSELFAPKGPGTILPHDVLQGIAQGGGGSRGGAPNVTINNVNNSSQNVDMKQGGVSYDAEARQFVIHTVLEDAASGGPVAGMLSGFSRN